MRSNSEKLLVDGSEVTLVNFSSSGLRIQAAHAADAGATVNVSGQVEGWAERISVSGPCTVRWCADAGQGSYHVGLDFQHASDIPRAPVELLGTGVDFYEVLQLSRRADPDTIRRAYHSLARRYHPGNEELLRHMVKAHEVLSDPAHRAAFDLQLASHDQVRLHLFENWQRTRGVQAEVFKRQAILRLLSDQRFAQTGRPWIILRDFENLMGCPREYLEFSFWVLREEKLVTRGDNARYEITCQGVAVVEAKEADGCPPAFFPQVSAVN